MTRPDAFPFPVREVRGHEIVSTDRVASWWRLPGARWAFLTNSQRRQALDQLAIAYAALGGATATDRTRVHLRVTSSPHNPFLWASETDQRMRERVAAASIDEDRWAAHLVRTQQAMRGTDLSRTEIYLGVNVAPRSLLEKVRHDTSGRDRRTFVAAASRIDSAMQMPGLAARPADPMDLLRLVDRSAGLHLPAPALARYARDMRVTDLPTFTDGITLREMPGGQCVQVTGGAVRQGGTPVVRYVAVLSLGTVSDLVIPGAHQPWLAWAQYLPFPVEVSAQLDILTGAQARGKIQAATDRVIDQIKQYRRNDLTMPPQLEIVEQLAIEAKHRMDEGSTVTSTEVVGPIRLAVAGTTEDEVLERVLAVQRHYEQLQFRVEHPRGQRALMGEFIPGARQVTSAYTRHMPVDFWAAALPNLDTTVGSDGGMVLGHTIGASRRPVFWDMWEALYAEQTGLAPVIGELGSGKSFVLGMSIAEGVRCGARTTVLDPSGTLARIALMPEFASRARVIDLLTAPAGTLNPYAIVSAPDREAFTDDLEWLAAANVDEQRKMLAQDVLMMLLPAQYRDDVRTDVIITRAVTDVGGGAHHKLEDVVETIEQMAKPGASTPEYEAWATVLAAKLRSLQAAPLANLFFGHSDTGVDNILGRDVPLLIFTLVGLSLPGAGTDQNDWTTEQRMAAPLIHLAAYLATRRIFQGDRETPKLLALDETHFLAQWPAGRTLLNRAGRDGRKVRARVLAGSQLAADILGQTVGGLTVEAFIGRIGDVAGQEEALKILRVPAGHGYERRIGALSAPDPRGGRRNNRDFIFRDRFGRTEVVRITLEGDPDLLTALSTEQPIPAAWREQVMA